MAQTRTITTKKRVAFALLDAALRPNPFWRPPPVLPPSEPPGSFLVVEPWGLGDVVLSTVVLTALREHFPGARVTLLAKPYASELLAHSEAVDEIVEFDFPWTSFTEKYSPGRYKLGEMQKLFRYLRGLKLDVSLDARRDARSNVLTYMSGARRRIGYDFGGGVHLLTDVMLSGNQNEHKILDWLNLLRPLGIDPDLARRPTLVVTPAEMQRAREMIVSAAPAGTGPLVAVHPGASHVVKRWELSRFATVVAGLRAEHDARVVVIDDPEGHASSIASADGVPTLRLGMRELMAVLAVVDLLVCNDSGPMHIAGAVGTPVTALFGPSRSEWYGPLGKHDRVVHVPEVDCRPCFEACIYATNHCMGGISAHTVLAIISEQLSQLSHSRAR
ncbi:MAG TPA: glycosyltransferase family 9 protein [Gemmatimonadaceae bacterium]|nr:glycosyltransferase family 9 protein [Gemmatimonadaceae bacterium]